jgi:hypothetical protein
MNPANAGAHPFFQGKPSSSISDALRGSGSATEAADNLYLATTNPLGDGAKHLFPKRFYDMVPNFKASDYDYIIFDMPPLTQSSASLAIASAMDKVLLVVEAEKGGRDLMKRACAELTAARANVSGIFNKARSYGPKWLLANEVGSLALPWIPPRENPLPEPRRKKSGVVFRPLLWTVLFGVSVVFFFVVFQSDHLNVGENVTRGWNSLKTIVGLPSKKTVPPSEPGTGGPK